MNDNKFKKIYITSIAISIFTGILLFGFGLKIFPEEALMWIAFIPFFLFTYGVIGLIVNMQIKNKRDFFWWVIFPGLMAILFYVMYFIHLFILEPYLCPCLR
jgi:uncharacterized membrane protein HdeD (DUF308 family)